MSPDIVFSLLFLVLQSSAFTPVTASMISCKRSGYLSLIALSPLLNEKLAARIMAVFVGYILPFFRHLAYLFASCWLVNWLAQLTVRQFAGKQFSESVF